MLSDVLDKTYDLIDILKKDERYIRIKELDKIINEEYKTEIDRFNDIKEKYNEALKYGEYHPSLKDYERKLSEAKAELYKKEYVIEYNRLYREFQNELDIIIKKIEESFMGHYRGEHNGCKNKNNS